MIASIVDARVRPISQAVSPMPTMRGTLLGWFRPLDLTQVVKSVENFRTVEVEKPLPANGLWQPFTMEQLSIRPEGERSWRWFMVHTTIDVVLLTDDIIKRRDVPYRVMEKNDYTDNGFVEYHIVNAYDNPK